MPSGDVRKMESTPSPKSSRASTSSSCSTSARAPLPPRGPDRVDLNGVDSLAGFLEHDFPRLYDELIEASRTSPRDAQLSEHIGCVWEDNFRVYDRIPGKEWFSRALRPVVRGLSGSRAACGSM